MRFPFLFLIFILLLLSCANPVAPTGGDKDVEAPKILLSQPENGMLNYQGKKIELRFNEYFVFSASSDKLQITPALEEMPKFTVKGKTLLMELPETLKENTTYSISFLGAIKDFTEGNVIDYYKYVFSTGPFIDSSSISGTAFNASDKSPWLMLQVGAYSVEIQGC
ncbi:MAG: Ig-like domain-containing protein [Chitinophagales bacterium]